MTEKFFEQNLNDQTIKVHYKSENCQLRHDRMQHMQFYYNDESLETLHILEKKIIDGESNEKKCFCL